MKEKIHHEIIHYQSGNKQYERWFIYNEQGGEVLHRVNGPAEITYHGGHKLKETWCEYGKKHNASGAAVKHYMQWHKNHGKTSHLSRGDWFINDNFIRTDYYRHHKEGGKIVDTRYVNDYPSELGSWERGGDVFHRENGPAWIQYDRDGEIIKEQWFYDNQLHNENGPAIIEYTWNMIFEHWDHSSKGGDVIDSIDNLSIIMSSNKSFIQKCYHHGRRVSNDDIPTHVAYNKDGIKQIEIWIDNTDDNIDDVNIHRINGPAIITYHSNSKAYQHVYVRNSNIHCDDGPAYCQYVNDGTSIIYEEHRINGELHRTNKPAIIEYNSSGKMISNSWHIQGQEFSVSVLLDMLSNNTREDAIEIKLLYG